MLSKNKLLFNQCDLLYVKVNSYSIVLLGNSISVNMEHSTESKYKKYLIFEITQNKQ